METFTLEQASYLAEIIGLLAVVASIIYLAIQVKQSTRDIFHTKSQRKSRDNARKLKPAICHQ